MALRALGPATLEIVKAVEEVLIAPGMVACSGGADSLSLAAAASIVGRRRQLGVRAVVVDHGLQDGSTAHSQQVVDLLSGLGLPAKVLTVTVRPEGEGIEAAARAVRYAALAEEAAAGELVLLGHTLDDQAETVLLGLARGSGTRSLSGMAPRRGCLIRPLLAVRAATTRAACAELGINPWLDPHNAEARFTRVRVRERVLPLLEAELGPGVAESLARTAGLARDDADLLDQLAAEQRTAHPGDELDCRWLGLLAPALRGRVLRDWLLSAGAPEVSAPHVAAVSALVTNWHGQRWVEVPGLRVRREDGRLTCASVSGSLQSES